MAEYMDSNMVKERDEGSGKFTQSVSDEEIIDFIDDQNGAATAEVADQFDYKRPSAYRRLKSLEEDGHVVSREIGNSLLWELADE